MPHCAAEQVSGKSVTLLAVSGGSGMIFGYTCTWTDTKVKQEFCAACRLM